MDSQGMAMLKMQGNSIQEMTVADPSRKLSRIFITVSGIYRTSGPDFLAFPDEGQHQTYFVVDLPQGVFTGKSVTLQF